MSRDYEIILGYNAKDAKRDLIDDILAAFLDNYVAEDAEAMKEVIAKAGLAVEGASHEETLSLYEPAVARLAEDMVRDIVGSIRDGMATAAQVRAEIHSEITKTECTRGGLFPVAR